MGGSFEVSSAGRRHSVSGGALGGLAEQAVKFELGVLAQLAGETAAVAFELVKALQQYGDTRTLGTGEPVHDGVGHQREHGGVLEATLGEPVGEAAIGRLALVVRVAAAARHGMPPEQS